MTAITRNPKDAFTFIGYLTLLAVAIFTARETARLCRLAIESALGKPKLIRETTRKTFPKSLFSSVTDGIVFLYQSTAKCREPFEASCEELFEDLILPKSLKERVMDLAVSAQKARQHDAPHRHILLYGPPGMLYSYY